MISSSSKSRASFTTTMLTSCGFTLIELLVVITILVILVTIGALSYYNTIKKTTAAVAQADFVTIYKNIEIARLSKQKTLGQITGNFCSECSCKSSANISIDPACVNDLTTSWQKISSDILPRDPWGNPYLWDENEQELGPNDCSTKDLLRSVGPDHRYGTPDDNTYQVPFHFCTP